MRLSLLAQAALVLGFTLACSGSDDDITNAEACQQIIEACHPKDDGMQSFSQCHEEAHAGVNCVAVHEECVEQCNAAPELTGGYETETDGHDTDHGSGSDTGTTG